MKLSSSFCLLATGVSLLSMSAQASPLFMPAHYEILPDLVRAAKQPSHQSHQSHYDIIGVVPAEHDEQEKSQHVYHFEGLEDQSLFETIMEKVFGKSQESEKDVYAQHLQYTKHPSSHRKDYHQALELEELAEIMEADGVVMIVS